MGRYFQPSGTQFIDNFIYQPPWQLMQNVLANKQQEYDSAVAATKLFRDIKINHLNGEDENYNVSEKQRYYNDKADAIAKAMQKDKLNAGSYNPNIEMLQKELVKDFTEGDISKIQGSYGAYQKWMEDNKKMKEESPYRYDAAEKHYLGQWANAGANSLNQQWKGDMVTKDVDWNKIYDAAEKMKSDEWEKAGTNHGGGYIYKNKNSGETLDEKDLMNNILSRVLTPDNKASLLQTQKYGLATYFNPETGGIDLNASGWIPARLFSNAAAYTKSKQDADVQSDGTWNNIYSQNQQNARQQAGFAHDFKKMQFADQLAQAKEARAKGDKTNDRIYNLQLDIAKETDSDVKKQKQDLLDSMTSAQFIVDLRKNVKYTDVKTLSKAAGKGDKDAYNVAWKSIDYARKNMNLTPEQREYAEFLDSQLYSGKAKDPQSAAKTFIDQKYPNLKYTFKETPRELEFKNMQRKAAQSRFGGIYSEYIGKRNEYLNEHSNTASSAYVGETLNPTGKTAATKLYQNYKDGFIAIDNKTKERLKVNPADLEIKGAVSGNSYGSVALTGKYKYVTDKVSEERDITLIPSQNNPVLVQAARGIAISTTDPKGTIHNELSNWRVNELKQTEANAKQAMKNTNEFVYRTYDSKGSLKSYNVNYSNGGYNIVNNQGAVIGTALGLDNLAEAINIDTNTK